MKVEDLLEQKFTRVVNGSTDIVFVGDPHCNLNPPRTRIDDYVEAFLNKWEQIHAMCVSREWGTVIILGDMFHKPRQNEQFHVRLNRVLSQFREDGIEVFSIAGNHDMINDRLDSLERTSWGMFVEMGGFKTFRQIIFNVGDKDLVVNATHYSEDIAPVSEVGMGDYNVMCAHMFYNYGKIKDSISKEQVKNLGYDLYALGHDHILYPNEKVGKQIVLRPGSLTRGTSHQYHLTREVSVDVLHYDGKAVLERVPLKVAPSEAVFSAVVTEKEDLRGLSRDIQAQFTNLITMLSSSANDTGHVYEVMDKVVMEPEVKERIEKYLYNAGIMRRAVNE